MASPQVQVGSQLGGLLKDGYTQLSGLEMAMMKNIEACMELGKLCRTSLGPNGMHKMVINHLEKLFITSDAATIMTELEVIHPAAKMLVMAAKMQEYEYGDCTNFVVSFASSLLEQAASLLRVGVHPAEVVSGYIKARDAALECLPELVCGKVENVRDVSEVATKLTAVISSKQNGYEDLLCPLISEACNICIPPQGNKLSLNTDSVRVAKLMGGNIHMSSCLKGMVIRRPPQGSVTRVENAKVAVFGMAVEAGQTETKGTVLISNAEELLNYNKSEEKLMEEQIKGIADSGVNVVVSGGAVSEMAQHYMDRYGLLCVKIQSKFELRRLCRTVGAISLVRLGPVMADEMGHCDLVEMREIAGGRCTAFVQEKEGSRVSTIVLRSSTTNQLDDLARAIDDGVNTIKTYCSDARLLPGGGACEIELASRLAALGEKTPGLEQYAIKKFAEALECVPKTLAENAGKDATEVVSNLYAAHKNGEMNAGIDVDNGGVSDMSKKQIFDTFAAKVQAMKLACDAAITVLRVDQIIMAKQAGGPKPPKQ